MILALLGRDSQAQRLYISKSSLIVWPIVIAMTLSHEYSGFIDNVEIVEAKNNDFEDYKVKISHCFLVSWSNHL